MRSIQVASILCFFLIFFTKDLFAIKENLLRQINLDSLYREADKVQDEKARLFAYQKVVEATNFDDLEIAVKAINKIILLAKKLYPQSLKNDSIEDIAQLNLELKKEELQALAEKYYELGYYDIAAMIGDKLSSSILQNGIQSNFEAIVLRQSAFTKNAMTKSDEAIVLLSSVLEYYLKNENKIGIATTYIDFAEFYRSTYNYSLGLEYIYKAKNILVGFPKEVRLRARLLSREAAILAEGYKNAESTIRVSKMVLKLANESNNKDLIATASNELGAAYNNDLRSIAYYVNAIIIWYELGKIENVNNATLNIARTFLNYNFKMEAIALANEVLTNSKKNNWLNLEWLSHEFLAEAYSKIDRWDESSMEMRSALQTMTLIEKQKQTQKLIIELRKHEMILAKKEAEYHKKQALTAKDLLEKEQLQRNLLITGVCAFIIILLILYFAYYKIKKVNKALNKTLEQREVLLKEVHHRVKNSLQLISSLLNLQSANLQDNVAQNAIKEGQSRVKTIALIHQKLYQTEDLTNINIKDYLQQLAGLIAETYNPALASITTEISCEDIELDIDNAVPIGLIINELVSNSYKYAFVGKDNGLISIALSKTSAGELLLKVSDNGVGMQQSIEIDKIKSLGLRLVWLLTKQLKGKIEVSTENRMTVSILFPAGNK